MLTDYGEIWTRDGPLQLSKKQRVFMWRDEAQPLIAEGVLEFIPE